MIATVAVGTDGSGTAEKAVLSALELAERYGARIVFISAYAPVDEGRLRHEKREAPDEIQWAINPEEDVDATLREASSSRRSAACVGERGGAGGSRRDPGPAGRQARRRRAGDRQQRHAAPRAGQRAELRHT